jgi:hypothetical protein
MVPGSKGKEGETTGALMSNKLKSEKIGEIKK